MPKTYVEVRVRLAAPVAGDELETFLDHLEDCYDEEAVYAEHNGVGYVTAGKPTTEPPLLVAIEVVNALIGFGATVEAFDDDLVDTPEIASRVEASAETVRQWVAGRLKSAPRFPLPLGQLPGSVLVWDWSTVSEWIAQARPNYSDGVTHPSRMERHTLNVLLGSGETLSKLTQLTPRLRPTIGIGRIPSPTDWEPGRYWISSTSTGEAEESIAL